MIRRQSWSCTWASLASSALFTMPPSRTIIAQIKQSTARERKEDSIAEAWKNVCHDTEYEIKLRRQSGIPALSGAVLVTHVPTGRGMRCSCCHDETFFCLTQLKRSSQRINTVLTQRNFYFGGLAHIMYDTKANWSCIWRWLLRSHRV